MGERVARAALCVEVGQGPLEGRGKPVAAVAAVAVAVAVVPVLVLVLVLGLEMQLWPMTPHTGAPTAVVRLPRHRRMYPG